MARINQPISVQWDTVPGITKYEIKIEVRSMGKDSNSDWSYPVYGISEWKTKDIEVNSTPRNLKIVVTNGN